MDVTYSSASDDDLVDDMYHGTLLSHPLYPITHSASSATTTTANEDDSDKEMDIDIHAGFSQLSPLTYSSSPFGSFLKPSEVALSSSLASIASVSSLSSSSVSYIRSRKAATATTLSSSPVVTKAIVVPSSTDAASYAAATLSPSPMKTISMDRPMHMNVMNSLLPLLIGVITHIRDRRASRF